jgi:hypothetical protein
MPQKPKPHAHTRATQPTPFSEWTKNRKAGAQLRIAGTADPDGVIVLKGDAGARRDQLAAFFRDAPKEVREAAVEDKGAGLGDVVARATLSNGRVDSYNSTINHKGWGLEDYKRNPVVLFAHNGLALPVGRDLGAHIREGSDGAGSLVGVTRFVSDELDSFAAKVGRFVAAGILRSVSVGFEPVEFKVAEDRDDGSSMFVPVDFVRQDLREYSWTPVGANRDCLVDSARLAEAGVDRRDIIDMLERAIEGTGHLFVPRSELVSLRRSVGSAVIVDLGARGSFRVMPVRAPVADDDGIANAEAYVDDENDHPEDPDTTRAEGGVMLQCPECGAQAPVEAFVVLEPDEQKPAEDASTEGEPFPEDLAAVPTEALAAELARRVDAPEEPGEDEEFAADAEALADLIEDEEMRTTGRLP